MRHIFILFLSLSLNPVLSQGGCRLLDLVKINDIRQVSEHLSRDSRSRQNMDCFKSGEWLSPLMVAVKNDNLDMVKLLLDYGADMNKNLSNKIAIDHCVSETMRSFLKETGAMGDRLVEAARQNDLKKVEKLLQSSMIKVTSRDDQHYSAIAAAAEEGHAEMVKKLLELGSPVDYTFKAYHQDKTPLQLATEKGHFDCVKVLVQAGANLEGNLRAGWTPLMLAIQYQFPDIAKYLIEHGANMKLSVYNGSEPFSLAAARNEFDLLKFMLDKYNIIAENTKLNHEIMASACYSGNLDMFNYLIEKGITPVDVNPYQGNNQLVRACNGGNLEMVKILVENYQFDVNKQDEYKFTPLSTATAWAKDTDIIDYLLSKGANIDGPAHAGYTPITRAIGKKDILEHLLKQGANPNPPRVIQSPLETACAFNDYESVRILIKYGANVHAAHACSRCQDATIKEYIEGVKQAQNELASGNTKDSDVALLEYIKNGGSINAPLSNGGKTPLMKAVEDNNVELAKQLIKLGANVNLKSINKTPMMIATEKGVKIEMVELLLKHGAKLERMDNFYVDPLGTAVRNKERKMIDFFLGTGLDINHSFKDSTTIMHAAAQTGDLSLFKYLIDRGGNPLQADQTGKTPFIIAAYHGDMNFLRFMVEELKVDVNTISTNGAATAIKNVTWTDSLNKVKYLLEHGADPYLTLEGQVDAIQRSFENKHIDSLYVFFTNHGYKLKADIGNRHNVFDNMMKRGLQDRIIFALENNMVPEGFDTTYAVNLLHTALMQIDTVFCSKLLKYGADINRKTPNGSTLLHDVQDHGDGIAAKLITYLFQNDVNPNIVDRNGRTALFKCISRNTYQGAEVLLKAGCDPNHIDMHGGYAWNQMSLIREGLMPIPGHELESRNTKMLKLFKRYGADLSLTNPHDNSTALFTACIVADFAAVKYLHETIGLGVNDSTKYSVRPLYQSLITQGYTTYSMEMPVMNSMPFQKQIFKYLLDQGANPNFYSTQFKIYNSPFRNGRNHFVFYCAYGYPKAFSVLLDYIDPNMVAHDHSLVEFLVKMKLKPQLEEVLKKGGRVINPTTKKSALDIQTTDEIKKLLKKYN